MSKTTRELREAFLHYFESKSHKRDRSSPLIPHNDPTLLFINAGMNQFKDLFTGKETRAYSRATTCQKCVRAGGKHNDLEAVGFTRRHHTFFEMLGNFSFGDYFKKEAIEYAWEFLTEIIKLPKERLWVSVFENDDEAAELWHKISGLPKERIVRMGEKDNFWAMGDTGPCGPCSEIYFDRGEKFGPNETIFDGGERYLEIWNLVFMQFEKFQDGSMKPLPKPSVDTGMGLERLASVVQDVESNYLTDGLFNILQGFAKQLKKTYGKNADDDVALRVLTDHIRSVTFLMADGVQPSNEGRGYVLRRILRRAIRYGKKLGCERPFFHEGVNYLIAEMGSVYPELNQNASAIKKLIHMEEEKFFETLDHGLKLLESKTGSLIKGAALPGAVAFQLYDTFGFPLDLTEVILREQGLTLDREGFDRELENQRERSRSSWKGSGEAAVSGVYQALVARGLSTKFTGYTQNREMTQVLAILVGGQEAQKLDSGQEGEVVLATSPFYPEGGGQVGDQGVIKTQHLEFLVEDTRKPFGGLIVCRGRMVSGVIKVGDSVEASIDHERRLKTRINHTMTHVLHAVLGEVLGNHIKQAGSLVHPDYLRFDFNHFQSLSDQEIQKIEEKVNRRIWQNSKVVAREESLEEAIAGGAKAFFDEKYGDQVRVLSVGDFSKELCGGTHAEALGEAGLFKIASESSVASGVRRIVGITAEKAFQFVRDEEAVLNQLSDLLKAPSRDLLSRVEKLIKEKSELQKKLATQSTQASHGEHTILEIDNIKCVAQLVTVSDFKDLRSLSDQLKQKVKSGVVILGAALEGKTSVLVAVTDDIAPDFGMNDFVKKISAAIDGRGGGKPTFAQLGGSSPALVTTEKLQSVLTEYIKSIKLKA